MSATITPVGRVAKAKVGLAWLVASCADFQTAVGVDTAASAFERVHAQADDTPYSVETRPRAIVSVAEHEEAKLSLADFRMTLKFYLSFEFPPSEVARGKEWDEEVEFHNRLDGITSQIFAAQGQGTGYTAGETHVALRTLTYTGGGPVFDVTDSGELERDAYYYAGEFVAEVDA